MKRDGGIVKLGLGLALVLAGATRCSGNPLMSDPGMDGGAAGTTGAGGTAMTGVAGTTGAGGSGPDCSNAPIPAIACQVGRTVPVCTIDAQGRPVWKITCPDDPTGAGGSGAGGSGAGGAPCASTSSCAPGEVCTTEDGDCKTPPGCGPGLACPAVCYGNCRPAKEGPVCGANRCAVGMVCCNPSCGICTPPNGGCTQQICNPPGGGACNSDADCRLEADYCTGCDCRALAPTQKLPPCSGPGVACFVDPCLNRKAQCVNGQCAVAAP